MTTTSPSQPTIESVWLVECRYAPDGADTRTPFRSEHIRVAAERIADGRYVEVGAFADVSASIIIVRAGSEAEAVALVSDDVLYAQRCLGRSARTPIRSSQTRGLSLTSRASTAFGSLRTTIGSTPSSRS